MKNAMLSLGVILMAFFATNVAAQQVGGAALEMEKTVHDYGEIKQNADGNCEFKFTNTGDAPLIISNAKGSCGCTVPVWPKEPIAPGETSSIKVKYDTKRVGPINKSVTLTTNAAPSTTVLRIKGNISPLPAAGSPVKEKAAGAPAAIGGGL